jgi:hypothetical protein
VQHGVYLTRVEARDQAASVLCGDGGEVYAPATSFLGDLGHDRERSMESGADDESASTPGEFLSGRQRGVSELASVRLRGSLLPFPHLAGLHDDVVFVHAPIDLDGAEPE